MKKIYALILLLIISFSSCKKEEIHTSLPDKIFTNIVILGNSITYAPGTPGTEWIGTWGMAASAPELDYVHLLTKEFQSKELSSKVTIKNIADFERGFEDYNFDINLKELKDSNPDLLIIRIGENASLNDSNRNKFESKYHDLISYFKANNPDIHILGVGSIWGNEIADNIMSKQSDFITLHNLNSDPSNYAYGKFIDVGISQHPSDKGMRAIADLIWTKVQTIK